MNSPITVSLITGKKEEKMTISWMGLKQDPASIRFNNYLPYYNKHITEVGSDHSSSMLREIHVRNVFTVS